MVSVSSVGTHFLQVTLETETFVMVPKLMLMKFVPTKLTEGH